MEERKTYIVPECELLVPAPLMSGNSYGDNDGLINTSGSRMDPEDMCGNESTVFEEEVTRPPTSLWDE